MEMPEGWKRTEKALSYFDYYRDIETGEHLLTILSQESKDVILKEVRTMHELLKEMAEALELVQAIEIFGNTKQMANQSMIYHGAKEILKKFKEWK